VNFQGSDITSDGGVMLLRQVDKHIGLSKAVAQVLEDNRRQASCQHDSLALLRQRVYALACGYEDLNDHQPLRHGIMFNNKFRLEIRFIRIKNKFLTNSFLFSMLVQYSGKVCSLLPQGMQEHEKQVVAAF
jgi:hypothetical protein